MGQGIAVSAEQEFPATGRPPRRVNPPRRRRGRWLAAVRLSSALIVMLATLSWSPSPANAAGSYETARTTYEYMPDEGMIRVTIDLTIKNEQANTRSYDTCVSWSYNYYLGWLPDYYTCSSTTSWYVDSTSLSIEKEASNIKGSSASGRIGTSSGRTYGSYKALNVTFPRIWYGQTRRLTIVYDIKSGEPRSGQATRAGLAYASFCATGNGGDSGVVSVVIPTGFEYEVRGEGLTSSTKDGKTILTSATLSEPLDFFACIEARNDAAYDSRTISAGGQEVRVLAWPEDPDWAKEAADVVTRSLPELQALIGVPPPGRGPIVVREVTTEGLGSYAGTYDPAFRSAEVSEDLDASTIVHELAHVWFNAGLFNEQWMSEGYASYAEKAAGRASWSPCTLPGPYPGTGSPDLAEWKWLGPRSSEVERKVVAYQYDAACWIATSTAGHLGDTGLRAVLNAAVERHIPYVGAVPPETEGWGPLTWRTWLDLVDENLPPSATGGIGAAEDLLVTYGIADDPAGLAARATARSEYAGLEEQAGGWGIPYAVRKPMADWDFTAATEMMATARAQLAFRTELAEVLPEAELDSQVRSLFEAATSRAEIEAVGERAAALIAIGEEVSRVRDLVAAPRDMLTTLGLAWGPEPGDVATAAVDALADGDDAAASSLLRETDALLADAPATGALRATAASAAMIILMLTAVALVVLRNRRRAALAPAVTTSGYKAPSEMDMAIGQDRGRDADWYDPGSAI